MAYWIVEMPDSIENTYLCGLCHPHECNGNRGCPIPNAKRAVDMEWNHVNKNGKKEQVFSVEIES